MAVDLEMLLPQPLAVLGRLVSLIGTLSFWQSVLSSMGRILLGLVGALLLVLADLVSRTVMAPVILPIGALTSFLGAPMFLFLLFKGGKKNG